MLLMFILGCFVLPSLTEGADMKTFTCPHGRLTVTCDAGKVILIKQVKHGYYSGAFNASHCKYQVGDNTEVDDGNSKEVWENCNLQSTCSVPFIESGNYYLEMDYECVYKHTIDMLDICDTGSGTRLVAKHGYIYSPCYPNVSTWNESTYAFCQCNGTFQLPGKAEVMTLSVFHAFQETESLDVRWHAITNTPHTIRKTSPSFKTEQHATGSFDLKFSSSYRGSDWDRGFWLEFTANSPLEFKCSNTPTPKGQQSVTPPTCQLPPPATTPITTTTPTTTTPMTKTTTATPTATLSSGSSTDTTTANTIASLTESGVIVAVVLVPLFLIAVTVALIVVLVYRNGTIARLCKGHSNENTNDIAEINADCGPVYENVRKKNASRSNFDNPAFVGDQNPRLTQSSDIDNSSYVNVPAMAANPTHSHNQMMPTYENIEHGRNPGSRNLDTHREKAPSPGEDYSPYEEMGDTGARMPGVGTAAASGEETESPYTGLDPAERSEYLDLRHVGFVRQSSSK